MLRVVVEHNNQKTYFDCNNNWDKIHKSLFKIGLEKSILNIQLNDPSIKFHVTRTSGEFYNKIKNLITTDDSIYNIYNACKIIGFALEDKELFNYLQNNFDTNKINTLLQFDMSYQLFNYYKNKTSEQMNWVFNANDLNYEIIKLFNKPVLFTQSRLDKKTLPKNIYCYEIQHDDNHRGIVTLLGKQIIVNFGGTILSTKKIPLNKNGYHLIDEDKNVTFLNSHSIKLDEYINKFPPMKDDKVR